MKILVDTSIWIDFLNGKSNVQCLQDLIIEDMILAHKWIEGELRIGNIPESRNFFFDEYSSLPRRPIVSWEELFLLIEEKNLYRKGLSIIDIQIYASAKVNNSLVWTMDKALKQICQLENILYL